MLWRYLDDPDQPAIMQLANNCQEQMRRSSTNNNISNQQAASVTDCRTCGSRSGSPSGSWGRPCPSPFPRRSRCPHAPWRMLPPHLAWTWPCTGKDRSSVRAVAPKDDERAGANKQHRHQPQRRRRCAKLAHLCMRSAVTQPCSFRGINLRQMV